MTGRFSPHKYCWLPGLVCDDIIITPSLPYHLKSNQSWSKLTPLWDCESLQLMDKKTSPLGPIFYTSREINSSRTWDNFVFNILAGGSALINCVKLNIQFISILQFFTEQRRLLERERERKIVWWAPALNNHQHSSPLEVDGWISSHPEICTVEGSLISYNFA